MLSPRAPWPAGSGYGLRLGNVARADDDFVACLGEQGSQPLGHGAGAENCDGHAKLSQLAADIGCLSPRYMRPF